ncbi:hypothetical protein EVAR_14926_1 [Eumeta japonica]|uniref:Uncharacterized protein n=1 Tax=Eumeta variegata TaxID=151549 RepID=A0A4C1XLM7_EUMVA|nr:hypothetical protein EVAR_14926_1 [Eumeta japonica]
MKNKQTNGQKQTDRCKPHYVKIKFRRHEAAQMEIHLISAISFSRGVRSNSENRKDKEHERLLFFFFLCAVYFAFTETLAFNFGTETSRVSVRMPEWLLTTSGAHERTARTHSYINNECTPHSLPLE